MHRNRSRFAALPAMLLAIVLASCEHGIGPDAAAGPSATVVEGTDGQSYTLIEDRLPTDLPAVQASGVIGLEGGTIHLAGHSLTVPANAVSEPVVFTLSLVTQGFVEVQLTAVTQLLGQKVEQFAVPLTLSLSYARAPNVPSDVGKLGIVYLPGTSGYATAEPTGGVADPEGKVVRAQLTHFSRYCMASN